MQSVKISLQLPPKLLLSAFIVSSSPCAASFSTPSIFSDSHLRPTGILPPVLLSSLPLIVSLLSPFPATSLCSFNLVLSSSSAMFSAGKLTKPESSFKNFGDQPPKTSEIQHLKIFPLNLTSNFVFIKCLVLTTMSIWAKDKLPSSLLTSPSSTTLPILPAMVFIFVLLHKLIGTP
ncbi:hypothetical protein HanIR_Chr13g0656541 [Helianthus annuus]|nr:hypothetical protein HanIR_Chr13g0656541 [Helianthus annuus]